MNRRKKRKKEKLYFCSTYHYLWYYYVSFSILPRFFMPNIVVAPSSIIKPNPLNNKHQSFERALLNEDIEYESLRYATQSSTSVVTFQVIRMPI